MHDAFVDSSHLDNRLTIMTKNIKSKGALSQFAIVSVRLLNFNQHGVAYFSINGERLSLFSRDVEDVESLYVHPKTGYYVREFSCHRYRGYTCDATLGQRYFVSDGPEDAAKWLLAAIEKEFDPACVAPDRGPFPVMYARATNAAPVPKKKSKKEKPKHSPAVLEVMREIEVVKKKLKALRAKKAEIEDDCDKQKRAVEKSREENLHRVYVVALLRASRGENLRVIAEDLKLSYHRLYEKLNKAWRLEFPGHWKANSSRVYCTSTLSVLRERPPLFLAKHEQWLKEVKTTRNIES